jgi:hypothetical protein
VPSLWRRRDCLSQNTLLICSFDYLPGRVIVRVLRYDYSLIREKIHGQE